MNEEILVRMGLDAGPLAAGLRSARSTVRQKLDVLKSEEKSYTDWWSTELRKREEMETAASVRAATRANRARQLRRQRAESRESGGSQGFTPYMAGDTDGKAYAGGFASKLTKFFTVGFGAGLAISAISMVKEALEGLVAYFVTEYTKMWSGDTAAQQAWSDRLEASAKRMREIRKELQASAKELGEAIGGGNFDRATDAGKADILFDALKQAERKTQAARDELAIIKDQKGLSEVDKPSFIAAAAEAETRFNLALKDEFDLHKKLDAVQDRIAEKRKKEADEKLKKEEELNRKRAEYQAKINAAQGDIGKADEDFQKAYNDKRRFTLGELADINIGYNTSGGMARNIMSARWIAAIEKDAELAKRLRGDQDPYFLSQSDRAAKMRAANPMLKEDERFPFQKLAEAQDNAVTALEAILAKASNEGLKIVPVD